MYSKSKSFYRNPDTLKNRYSNVIDPAQVARIHLDVFHERRHTTNYLVGFNDIEESLANMIRETDSKTLKLADQNKELQKELLEYKR